MTDIEQMKNLLVVLTEDSSEVNDLPFIHIPELIRLAGKYHNLMVELDGSDESAWTFNQKLKEQELSDHLTMHAIRLGCKGVVLGGDYRGCVVKLVLQSGRTNDIASEGWIVPYGD